LPNETFLKIRGKQMLYYYIQESICSPYLITGALTSIPKKSWREPAISFTKGAKIEEAVPNPMIYEVNFPESVNPPYLQRTHPVVNGIFLEALQKAGVDNFQLFPAELHNPETGKKWTGYNILNVIGLVDAALLEECEYDVIMDGNDKIPSVYGFHKRVFSAEKLKNKPEMFRLWHSKELCISERVADVLKTIMTFTEWNLTGTPIEVK
jgi:hypothetical protein